MNTKITATIADDGFGSEVDFTDEKTMAQVHRDYLAAVRDVAEKRFGENVELDIDFEPTNLGDKWFAEIEGKPVTDFDGDYFSELVWNEYCNG